MACYGESIACVDMNNDGYDDFLVGASYWISNDDTTRIFIYKGGDRLSITPVWHYIRYDPPHYGGRKMESLRHWNGSEYGMVLAGFSETDQFWQGITRINGASDFDSISTGYVYNTDNPGDMYFFAQYADGDFNGDGKQDIVINGGTFDSIQWLFYLGDSDLDTPDTIYTPEDRYIFQYYYICSIDMNNDGISEFVVMKMAKNDYYVRQVEIYSNNPYPVGITNSPVRPERFILEPCYPNPFNANTIIPFQLTEKGQITLSVYDIKGCQVAELTRQFYTAGNHSLTWNAGDLPSGIYFIGLHNERHNTSAYTKAIIIK